MKRYSFSFFLILLAFCSVALQAIDIQQIKEIKQYIISGNTLIVFDIDNTLLTTKTDLGSDQWFSFLVQEKMNMGITRAQAVAQVLPLYYHVHSIVDLVSTESDLHAQVADIKELCDYSVCLTARSLPLASRTIEQLQMNQLTFHDYDQLERELSLTHPSMYKGGVLFCGMNEKGEVLMHFLDLIDYHPEVIIFVDDKEKYIANVQAAAEKRNIHFIGLRYTGCDDRVLAYNHEATQQELKEFLLCYPCGAIK